MTKLLNKETSSRFNLTDKCNNFYVLREKCWVGQQNTNGTILVEFTRI